LVVGRLTVQSTSASEATLIISKPLGSRVNMGTMPLTFSPNLSPIVFMCSCCIVTRLCRYSDVVARYRDNIGVRVKEFLKYADIPVDSKPFVDIAVTNPAFEESAMFDKMIDIMLNEAKDFDRIVFDTAAVANAIRLIGLSKIYGLWLGRMIDSRKEALSLRVQLSFRKEKVEAEVKKDPMLGDLIDMNDRFNRVKHLLVDPEITAFFFVTLPLTLPISVVTRFIAQVKAYDIPVGGVLVNSCIRAEEAAKALGDEYLQNKFREQLTYMQTIQETLGDLVRSYVPLYNDEVHGLKALRQVAADMFAPADPTQFTAVRGPEAVARTAAGRQ